MNVDKEDRTPDIIRTGWGKKGDAELQLTVIPALERRRVLWVIVPKDVAATFEEELLTVARKYGKIKLHGEETGPRVIGSPNSH